MPWHPREREALADALLAAGPGAATLCDGWLTQHLAAHVVLRERDPVVAAGVAGGPLASRTARVTLERGDAAADPDAFAGLVATVRSGPPRWSPLAWVGDAAQHVELFVHAEDVRRGDHQARPRALPAGEQEALWSRLLRASRLLYRDTLRTDALVLHAPGRAARVGPRRDTEVVLTGEVGELVLHAYGRPAIVDVTGDREAVERVLATTRRV